MLFKQVTTFIFLLVFWLLFTFSLDPFSLLLGVLFSFAISVLTADLFIEKGQHFKDKKLFRWYYFFNYLLVLFYEIYLGSFWVAYSVLTMRINPGLVKIKTRLKSDLARVLLANSITLTPGTVTVDLEDDQLVVHWLNVRSTNVLQAAKKIKGSFETQLGRLFS